MAKAKKSPQLKRALRDRTRLEWALFIAILIILYLLLASIHFWWPWRAQDNNLGTAFYTPTRQEREGETKNNANNSDNDDDDSNGGSGGGSNNGGGGSNNGGGGNNNGGDDDDDGNNGGGSSSSSLLDFAADLDTGDSKKTVSGRARNLNERCSVTVNSQTAGKQEVCTYTEGDKIVTVTYLDDQVVSASRSGF